MSQSSLVSPSNRYSGEDARRSTRIDRSVPLIVFGQNRLGEPFVERTVSTSLNLHGCRYPSRHDYGVGSWVTLQVVGLNVEPKPSAVRARVRSVHTSQSSRELQQVGVELENPGNVWGVVAPPQDWSSSGGANAVIAQFAAAVPPVLSPTPPTLDLDESPAPPEHKMAEVATFPSPSSAAAKSQPSKPFPTKAPNRSAWLSRQMDSSRRYRENWIKPRRKQRKRQWPKKWTKRCARRSTPSMIHASPVCARSKSYSQRVWKQ